MCTIASDTSTGRPPVEGPRSIGVGRLSGVDGSGEAGSSLMPNGIRKRGTSRTRARSADAHTALSQNGACESRFSAPQPLHQRQEIGGQRRVERQRAAVHGMLKREPAGMQRLAWKRNRAERVGAVDVALLANQRVAAQPRLQADL